MITYKDDISEKLSKLYDRKMAAIVRDALKVVGQQIVHDALFESPTPPLLTNELRRSWFVAVEGRIVDKGPEYNGDGQPSKTGLTVGFGAGHAIYMETMLSPEGPLNPSPLSISLGAGGGFLSSKLSKNARKYADLLADEIRKAME